MKETMRSDGSAVEVRREGPRRFKKRACCSICTRTIWFHPVQLREPEGVPEPRLSWVLCKRCYEALLDELHRSPVRSPLRLRIAMGMVASERWPDAYPSRISTYISDRRWIVFMAVGFFVAIILHLILIVAIAGVR